MTDATSNLKVEVETLSSNILNVSNFIIGYMCNDCIAVLLICMCLVHANLYGDCFQGLLFGKVVIDSAWRMIDYSHFPWFCFWKE